MLKEILLFTQIKKGDIKAFEQLFRQYYSPLCWYAASIVGNWEAAEEIVEELFYTIWKEKEKLNIFSSVKNYLYTAAWNGEEIPMTVREFNILYKLLSYPRKTFTRQQLMDEFWDADSQTAPRAVDVYMTRLRSKLADCDGFEIKTVHGLGYKAVIK